MISVLFVQANSIYKKLHDGNLDCWDSDRDARGWPGGCSAICHPPCRSWSRLRHFSKAPAAEKELAIDSIAWVRKYGGIVEHPASSGLWAKLGLPKGQEIDEYGGYTLSVDQLWWGHKAKKSTWLYIVGCWPKNLPPIPITFDAIQFVAARSRKKGPKNKEISTYERSATPRAFAEWLIQVAEICDRTKNIDRAGPV